MGKMERKSRNYSDQNTKNQEMKKWDERNSDGGKSNSKLIRIYTI